MLRPAVHSQAVLAAVLLEVPEEELAGEEAPEDAPPDEEAPPEDALVEEELPEESDFEVDSDDFEPRESVR